MHRLQRSPDALPGQRCEEARPPVPPLLASAELLRGGREVLIQHAGTVYRLLHTRNGKLILTK